MSPMKHVSKAFLAFSVLAAGLFVPATSYAWDGVTTGAVAAIHVTDGTNFGFRVQLAGTPPPQMCTVPSNSSKDNASEAFLNEKDSNYKTYVAMLMMAKATGATVTIFTTSETYTGTDANGNAALFTMCHIGYIKVN